LNALIVTCEKAELLLDIARRLSRPVCNKHNNREQQRDGDDEQNMAG